MVRHNDQICFYLVIVDLVRGFALVVLLTCTQVGLFYKRDGFYLGPGGTLA